MNSTAAVINRSLTAEVNLKAMLCLAGTWYPQHVSIKNFKKHFSGNGLAAGPLAMTLVPLEARTR